MRSGTLESHDEFEGVGAHEANPRFDFIEGEHEADVEMDDLNAPVIPPMPALAVARAELLALPPAVRLDGIDVSHYQADVRWDRVRRIPTFWAATKLTQSTGYADPTGQATRGKMTAAGFRYRLLYHWLSPTTDPEKQAAWFIRNAGELALGEGFMCDSEENGVTVDMVCAFLDVVEARYRRCGTDYSGAYVAGGTIWRDPRVREGKFGPRPQVLAAYTSEAKAKQVCEYARFPWSSWQFSSSGPVDGVLSHTGAPDRCDMNRVDDIAAYDRACGYTPTATPGPVEPAPVQHTDPPAPPAPAGPPPTVAQLAGDTDMPGYLAANKDARGQSSEPGFARYWMGEFVKRHVVDGNEIGRLVQRGLLPKEFDLANLDDPSLVWLSTDELNSYPTV